MNLDKINKDITALEKECNGEFSIAVRRLDREGVFTLRQDRVLPTASVCKLFVLCELFRQAEAGIIDLNESITWKPEHQHGGSGVLRAMTPGQQLSIHNMAVLMIIVSDNVATDALTDIVGSENITRTIREWGLSRSDMGKGLFEAERGIGCSEPVSTARDLCELLTRIYRNEILTPESCSGIIRIMRAQRCNQMLPRYIPIGEDWGNAPEWIASKSGSGKCRADTGIVHTRECVFSIAVFFKPNERIRPRFKCQADHPPDLAVAKACRAIYYNM